MRMKLLIFALAIEIISTLSILYGSYLQYSSGNFPTFLGMLGAAGIALGSLVWAKFYDGETVIEILYETDEESDRTSNINNSTKEKEKETLELIRETTEELYDTFGEVSYMDDGVTIRDNVGEREQADREWEISDRIDL